jgi:thiol:disulfide interchange protein DsbD
MTCKWNEAVALNTDAVHSLIQKNRVIAIKADKTRENPEIDRMLTDLGNPGAGIPFLAIFPSDGRDPITFDGPITEQMVLDALESAGPSGSRPEVAEGQVSGSATTR